MLPCLVPLIVVHHLPSKFLVPFALNSTLASPFPSPGLVLPLILAISATSLLSHTHTPHSIALLTSLCFLLGCLPSPMTTHIHLSHHVINTSSHVDIISHVSLATPAPLNHLTQFYPWPNHKHATVLSIYVLFDTAICPQQWQGLWCSSIHCQCVQFCIHRNMQHLWSWIFPCPQYII